MKEIKMDRVEMLGHWLRSFSLTRRQERDDVAMACEIHLAHVQAIQEQTIEIRRNAGALIAIDGEVKALREAVERATRQLRT